MLNKDKVKGILRAKHGSQIPQFLLGGSPNIYTTGTTLAISLPDSTDTPLPSGNFSIDWKPETPLLYGSTSAILAPTINNNFETPEGFPEYLKTKSLFNIAQKNWKKFNKDFAKQTGTYLNGFQKVMGGISNFSKNNPNLVAGGLDALGGLFNKGITNNSGTNTIFGIGDTVANGLMAVNPVAGLIGKGVMTAVKGINNIFGKRTKDFSVDQNTLEQVGGSYGGSVADINEAASKANKKYGLFSSGSRRRANKLIDSADLLQDIMADIAGDVMDLRAMINDLNYINYNSLINGGYDQRYMRAAKSGMKLLDKINFVKQKVTINSIINLDTKTVEWEPVIELKKGGIIKPEWEPVIEDLWEPIIEIPEFLEGGKLEKSSFEDWFNSIPENNRANQYDYKKAYEVFDWEILSKHAKDPENNHLYSVSPIADENGNYPFLKLGKIEDNPEIQGEFDWYNSEEGKEHKSKFDIEYINDRYYYVPKKFKEGGKTKEELETPEIEKTNQKNLIPEGALHKNKHHMEHTEGLTLKGIPVIDNGGELLAEIELDEIIFTLEVTKKLEELYKEGTDKAAIEAGKLLVKEILFNTDDRTGLIAKCLEGGKL